MNAEEIRQNIPIFEVAERLGITGNLRAAGDNEMRGPCPLHGGDNRDAFSMYQDSNRWECRTHCGKGSQIDLVMKAQGFDAAGAIRWIKEAFHLEAGNGSHPQAASRPQPKAARIAQKEPKPDGALFSDIYTGLLSLLDDPQPDGYLTRARGVTVDTLKRNGVKQISEARRQTIEKDMAELFPVEQLKACGLFPPSTFKAGPGTYFIFRKCDYVYSFHDQAGRIVNLQGVTAERHRTAGTGKYIYLKDIEKPVLYLPLDFSTWRPEDDVIITEAVLDALSAVDLGLKAVAIPDTGGMKKATAADLEPLRPFVCRILGDYDIAGVKAKQALYKTMIEGGFMTRRESWHELLEGLNISAKVKDFNDVLQTVRGTRAEKGAQL